MSEPKILDVRAIQYDISVSIQGTPQRVWRALTDQLSTWWLPDFHMLGTDSLVTLEPKAGGRLYEQNGDSELLWYTVLAISPEDSLSLVGYCTPDFGGPLTTMLTARVRSDGEETVLTITDALYGHVSDGQVQSLQSGWKSLFTDGLKAFVEADG
jgi:uncharacterized protein YndB with AHSA1/START domain